MTYPSEGERAGPVPGPGSSAGVAAAAAILSAVLPLLGGPVAASGQDGPDSRSEHRVRPGDTLWDLAARYLGDPHAWEELYRLNRERLTDPSRLVPGQVLRLPTGEAVASGGAGPAEAAPRAGEAGPGRAGRGDRTREAARAAPTVFDEGRAAGTTTPSLRDEGAGRPPLVSASDVRGAPWLGPPRLETVGSVVRVLRTDAAGLELPPTVRVRDRVVLALTAADVGAGRRLQALRAGRSLEGRGRVYRPVGLLEVVRVRGDSARARVTALYGRFEVGAPLVVAPALPDRRSVRTVPARDSMRTRVVATDREGHLVGGVGVVFLDASGPGEIRPGDEFALYRREADGSSVGRPRHRVAMVRVVRVTPRGATARVVEFRDVGAGPGSAAIRIRRPAP